MSQNAQLQAVLYASEASFCEVSSAFGTALPLIDEVDLTGLARKKIPIPHMKQRRNEGYQDALDAFSGQTFKLKGRLTGLGATCSGAVPSSDLWTFLGLLIGNIASGLATGTTFTGGTAAIPTTTAANGATVGGLVHGGAPGDTRVGGGWLPVTSHASNSLTLLLAANGAPSNGDVLYASKVVYPTEDPGEVPTSLRFQFLTSNGQFQARGCFCTAFRITGSMPGGTLEWEADMQASQVDTANVTFPTATAAQRFAGRPALVNGTFGYAAHATTTRSTEALRDLTLEFDVGCEGIKGSGAGNYEGQLFKAVRRKSNGLKVTMVVDAEAVNNHTWRGRFLADPNTAALFYHFILDLMVQDGSAVGLYVSRAKLCDVEPMQMNHEGYNRLRLTFEAVTNTVTTSALTLSSWRLGAA